MCYVLLLILLDDLLSHGLHGFLVAMLFRLDEVNGFGIREMHGQSLSVVYCCCSPLSVTTWGKCYEVCHMLMGIRIVGSKCSFRPDTKVLIRGCPLLMHRGPGSSLAPSSRHVSSAMHGRTLRGSDGSLPIHRMPLVVRLGWSCHTRT